MMSVLHATITNGAPMDEIIQLVTPTNINAQDEDGYAALHLALETNRWDVASALLQHGADVDLVDSFGQTPLCIALWPLSSATLDANAIESITNQLISHQNIKIQDKSGRSALHHAVVHKRWDAVPLLLEYGADINMCDCNQNTPLHGALHQYAPADIVALLVSRHNVNLLNKSGCSVLYAAVWFKLWGSVRVLLDFGADVNLCNQNIPLHMPHPDQDMRYLIKPGVDPVDLCENLEDTNNNTALHMALNNNAPADVIASLISPDSLNVQNSCGMTPLALYKQTAELEQRIPIERLITHININMRSKDSLTPLHRSVMGLPRSLEAVNILLNHGADVNLSSDNGRTALHWSILYLVPSEPPIDLYISLISTCNINVEDNMGRTPLHCALLRERWKLVPIFVQHGANPFLPGILPEPPLPHSLQLLCIVLIRSHMRDKSDEGYLSLKGRIAPGIIRDVKMTRLAGEIVHLRRCGNGPCTCEDTYKQQSTSWKLGVVMEA